MNRDEPEIHAPGSVHPPSGLEGAGLEEWREQVARLSECGVLTAADLKAFEDYCRALSELRIFEAQAKAVGPELAIAKGFQGMVVKLRAQVNQLRQQCGLTPSSRSGVKAAKPKGAEQSPAARYLSVVTGSSKPA